MGTNMVYALVYVCLCGWVCGCVGGPQTSFRDVSFLQMQPTYVNFIVVCC